MEEYVDFHGYKVYRDGSIISRRGKIMKPKLAKDGYHQVSIYGFEGCYMGRRIYKVHRLVAECFIPNPDNKPQVNHINGIKTDNRVENLEWVTPNENMRHAYKTGLVHHKSILSLGEVNFIKANYQPGKNSQYNLRRLGEMFNVSKHTIHDIVTGRRWKHIE